MSGDSERVKAFRDRMQTLVAESARNREAAGQRWQETLNQAEKRADEQVAKAQKLVERVRERAAYLRRQEESNEISVGEEVDEEDRDPEVERFAQSLREQQREQERAAASTAQASAASAAPTSAPGAATNTAAPGQPPAPGAAPAAAGSSAGASVPGAAAPAPQNTWQVQAGRFGRQDSEESDQSPSKRKERPTAQAHGREQRSSPAEAPRTPARRREPVFDDEEEDFSNQTWLR